MIDHIKLAEECEACISGHGVINMATDDAEFTKIDCIAFGPEEIQAYTNAILEHAAVKCDEKAAVAKDLVNPTKHDAKDCAEAIRQEKV